MGKWINVLWLVVVIILSFGCYISKAQESEDFKLIGQIYVGEFEKNSAELTSEMINTITGKLALLPKNLELSMKLRAYTDNSGTKKANKLLSQKRLEAVENILHDLIFDLHIIDAQAYIYEPGVNEVNKRFAVIEIWAPLGKVIIDLTVIESVLTLESQLSKGIESLIAEIADQSQIETININKGIAKLSKSVDGRQTEIFARITESKKIIDASMATKFNAMDKKIILVAVITLFSVLIVSLSWLSSRREVKAVKVVNKERHNEVLWAINSRSSKQPIVDKPLDEEVDVKVIVAGDRYIVVCRHFRDEFGVECWISPFVTKTKVSIHKETRSILAKSLKGCLTKPTFADQKEALMKDKKIKQIT